MMMLENRGADYVHYRLTFAFSPYGVFAILYYGVTVQLNARPHRHDICMLLSFEAGPA